MGGGEGATQVRVTVTGADGFVGRFLVRHLLEAGHTVTGALHAGAEGLRAWLTASEWSAVTWVPLELTDRASVDGLVGLPADGIVHLAGLASNVAARKDPGAAWDANASGTARLVDAAVRVVDAAAGDPVVVVVSSGEVYGRGGTRPFTEADPALPHSPYAASKVGAEVAALEGWRRRGLRVVVARPFTHTGPGQPTTYLVPALAERLSAAQKTGERSVPTGNLEPVRDMLDVRDVVHAYLLLLERGSAGETYNISRGEGIQLLEVFAKLARFAGADARPDRDPALARSADIPYLVGDPGKLALTTGWAPSRSLDDTLRDVLNAQAH